MKPGAKLAAFALVLAVAFGGGTALGAAFAPDAPPVDHTDMPGMDHTNTDHTNTTGMNDANMPGMHHTPPSSVPPTAP